ncbi:MAG TPA: hypothetical protein VG228_09765 [Solirubrobacteraceae bacterium]|jgi:hypothetical protein|nr:hypothetical protein [Solirubrobacteraceae bacterium]
MDKRSFAATIVAVGLLVVTPSAAGSRMRHNASSPAIMAEGLPMQCVVPPELAKMSQASASALLWSLGCKVRLASQPSTIRVGRVIGVVGGVRSYPYHHRVTLLVSSGS